MSKKKVLICVPALDVGGAEKFAVDLALHLDKTKFDVKVAETRRNSSSFLVDVLKENNIEIVDLSGSNYLTMLKKQLAYLRKEKIDIVHTQIGSLLHMMLACNIVKTDKRIYTLHNEAKLLYGNNKFRKYIFKLAFTTFKFVPVAISKTIKKSLYDDLHLDNIEVVNNGIDVSIFKPVEKEDGSITRIISVGSLYWIKNQMMMIDVVHDIHQNNKNIELTLIGDGEDREKLQNRIVELGDESFIKLLGKKQNVQDFLQNSDIYISASKTEGLPLSIAEAMACGLPIVATKAGGVVDLVKDKENGYLVDIDDEKRFKDKLNYLIDNKDIQKQFSNKSLELVQNWTIDKCVSSYEKLYEGQD